MVDCSPALVVLYLSPGRQSKKVKRKIGRKIRQGRRVWGDRFVFCIEGSPGVLSFSREKEKSDDNQDKEG